ncbi:MAG: FtsW/RodA/SpoVE family cell cycle protein [Chlorobi bacterium]|nr:FtsW/RodA/SpoVE family cell cycle protein [Chlorobiota bacterium]
MSVQKLLPRFKGDITLLIITGFLVLISFAVVFSTSSNLVNVYHTHSHWFYFAKHLFLIAIAAFLFLAGMYVPVELLKKWAPLVLAASAVLLLYTLLFGVSPNGDHARRWIRLPFATIQPSFIALYAVMLYTAVFADKIKNKRTSLWYDFKVFWLFVLLTVGLILPANNSTALMIVGLVMIVLFLGGYPLRKLVAVTLILAGALGIYYLAAKAFPQAVPNRFETLERRIVRFIKGEDEKTGEITQPMRAKMAIASGGVFRWAPGKSVQKNMLSQSSSDFVYAVIIEEYGLFGGLVILFLYFMLLVRFFIISQNLKNYFEKLLVMALGLPVIAQAFINMSVATGLIPVTGQPLPLISTGGTTIMMTGLILGIIVKISEAIYDEK